MTGVMSTRVTPGIYVQPVFFVKRVRVSRDGAAIKEAA